MMDKNSIRIVGIDNKNIYELIYITQGRDGSFYYGLCKNCNKEIIAEYSRHTSGDYHVKIGKKKFLMGLEKKKPLSKLEGYEQLAGITYLLGGMKKGLKKYVNKKFDGIFAIDLRNFKKNLSLTPYLIPNVSIIDKILINECYEEAQFYLFMKTNPKILIIAHEHKIDYDKIFMQKSENKLGKFSKER